MKFVGWVAVVHAFFIVFWMIFNIIFSLIYPLELEEGKSFTELGMEYHSDFIGYLSMDHGSKSLLMLVTIVVPIATYNLLKKKRHFELCNTIGLFAGTLGFFLYSISLMIQAVSVAYAINLFNSDANDTFALYLYEWVMLEGGFSTSLYILANLLISFWLILHFRGFYRYANIKKISVFGMITGLLLITAYLISWVFLMFGIHMMHMLTEATGLLFLGFILLLGLSLMKDKIRVT
ncbi:hypothetical protein [Virgibacillus ainsalahensis]